MFFNRLLYYPGAIVPRTATYAVVGVGFDVMVFLEFGESFPDIQLGRRGIPIIFELTYSD